jgi:hypothetical protein
MAAEADLVRLSSAGVCSCWLDRPRSYTHTRPHIAQWARRGGHVPAEPSARKICLHDGRQGLILHQQC